MHWPKLNTTTHSLRWKTEACLSLEGGEGEINEIHVEKRC